MEAGAHCFYKLIAQDRLGLLGTRRAADHPDVGRFELMLDNIKAGGIVGDKRGTGRPGGAEGENIMISRRKFLSLLPVVPPVYKALVAHDAEWNQFTAELSRALSRLRAGHFLIIETKGDLYYVQFAGGNLGMRAEAVSNGYLEAKRKLSDKACVRLLQLGWHAPTIIPDPIHDVRGYKGYGSPNYS